MTLQERMVAVYLRQAMLPPEEKDKLRLFLGLLLTTLDTEEAWEKEMRAEAAPSAPAMRFEGEGREKVPDPLEEAGASAPDAGRSSEDAHGEEPGMKDPLVYEVLERMEQEKLSKNKVLDATGLNFGTLDAFLKGKPIAKRSLQKIADWMEPWQMAKEILG